MDWVDRFALKALETVKKGYYKVENELTIERKSLAQAIRNSNKIPIIAELKLASPTKDIKIKITPEKIINTYSSSNIVGISVITEPYFFKGSLKNLKLASLTKIPTLMKDFVVSKEQVIAGKKLGASAVLLILELFKRNYPTIGLEDMIECVHKNKLEVVLEIASKKGYKEALTTSADMIGINNRDLRTLRIDLRRTERILRGLRKSKPVISMSGISSLGDIKRLAQAGADAFLIGTALLKAPHLEQKLKEFLDD
ncbi:MAG: indole-3-glycerol-phosphate synthase [Candidatus Thermoplasmatota archaeon]